MDPSKEGGAQSAGRESPHAGAFQYDPLPTDDRRVIRVLSLLPGAESTPIACTLMFAALPSAETRIPKAIEILPGPIPVPFWGDLKPKEPNGNHKCNAKLDVPSQFALADYDALSYVWGDSAPNQQIALNGCGFEVTPNLHAALRHLRDGSAERTLWVDAICIDQSNTKEKEREVSRIDKIYYHARQVVVWLGEGTPPSDIAMDFASRIYECFQTMDDHDPRRFKNKPGGEYDEGFIYWMDSGTRISVVDELLDNTHLESWTSFHELLQRPWWERAWVLQEITLASNISVQCGNISKPWIVINAAAQIAYDTWTIVASRPAQGGSWMPASSRDVVGALLHTRHRWRQYHRVIPSKVATREVNYIPERAEGALQFLMANTQRKCKLLPDKIFSVLGLLPEALAKAIRPNYQHPSERVFKEAVRTFIQVTGSLNIICHSQYSPWQQADLPSWMPDWTRQPRMAVYADQAHTGLGFYNPVGDTKACITISDDLSVLTAEGFVVGTVKFGLVEFALIPGLAKVYGEPRQHSADILSYPNGHRVVVVLGPGRSRPSDPSYWNFGQSFWQIIGPHIKGKSYYEVMEFDLLSLFLQCLQKRLAVMRSEIPAPEESRFLSGDEEAEFANIPATVHSLLVGRTLVVLDEKIMGFAPDFTQPGDLVCLLKGCDSPVILRKQANAPYMFIGDSYFLEFQRGEGMEGLKEGKYTLEKFPMGPALRAERAKL
ncbi:uncharacterized protein A1O5_02543 [Cladophialophora psammophila CBS 110553]|uniref:Heterokaryon incompatibility domain-containing protein n=1 Tax=Cladophialophora psammophila CBS 110553 TaxID=1182543 RepID=W9X1A0_9EURO|nr:uncharacterized protein A1O5_02543 [Cladophialophora psammophila CBS 110553]EXJ74247.1 hypothetical protein A1O5_02543 [Cladophialophora psammophila CBS 110553]